MLLAAHWNWRTRSWPETWTTGSPWYDRRDNHAEAAFAMGFCLFNNVAITARYLQQKHGLERILILDWDVHHGNGTQHTFESDPTVFYISLHQFPPLSRYRFSR